MSKAQEELKEKVENFVNDLHLFCEEKGVKPKWYDVKLEDSKLVVVIQPQVGEDMRSVIEAMVEEFAKGLNLETV